MSHPTAQEKDQRPHYVAGLTPTMGLTPSEDVMWQS